MRNRRTHTHATQGSDAPAQSSGVSIWQVWREAARPRTLPAAIAPVLAASGLAWHDGGFDWRAALLCAAFALLMQVGANFANDYYDGINGGDTSERRGPRRAVASGLVAARTMRAAMWAVFALGFGLGLGLVAWGGWWLVGIGLVSVLCAVAYTGGPYPLAYHGWGDVFVFIFFGPVAVGATYYVQVGEWTWGACVLSVPIGLLAANLLVLNNYRDEAEDRRVGKRTTVVRFGQGFARVQFGMAFGVSFALPMLAVFGGAMSPWLLLPCVLLPEAWRQQAKLEASHEAVELIKLLGASGRFLAAYALLVAVGLFASAPRVPSEVRIDREGIVRQHSPVMRELDPTAARSVGNGRFVFTSDVTGLQTLVRYYQAAGGVSLDSIAHWVSPDAPDGMALYPLGQIGFTDERGRELRPEDFSKIEQTLHLWSGELVSRFEWRGFPVEVRTIAHPENDAVAVRIESTALAEGWLRVGLSFPSLEGEVPTVQRIDRGRRRADFVRQADELGSYAAFGWSEGGRLETAPAANAGSVSEAGNRAGAVHTRAAALSPYRFLLRPAPREKVLEMTIEFSRLSLGPTHRLATWRMTRAAAARHWESFWQTAAETTFSEPNAEAELLAYYLREVRAFR